MNLNQSNHAVGQNSHAIRLVFSCHEISSFQQFMSGIAEQHIVTICQDVNQLKEILTCEKSNLLLIEVPQNKSAFLSSLKKLTQIFSNLPIILIGDQLLQDELIAAFNLGINDYFPTPVDEKLLLERVNSIIKNIQQTILEAS